MKIVTKGTFIVGKGEKLPSGSEIERDDATGQRLISAGVGQASTGQAVAAAAQRPTGAALIGAIVDAIRDLKPDEDFTKSGVPVVAAIEKRLGYDISAEERDKGWEAAQKAHTDLFAKK